MPSGLAGDRAAREHGLRVALQPRPAVRPRASRSIRLETSRMQPQLQWQTPAATDIRFGFEITMYVAAR